MQPIHHLFSRAGFGLSPQEWARWQDQQPHRAVDQLLREARVPKPLEQPKMIIPQDPEKLTRDKRLELIQQRLQQVAQINAEWMLRMAHPSESALLERMTLFWHGHFACEIRGGELAISYLNTLRQHGLGHFGELTKAVAREPAMIRYLNNQQNRKQSPNENFARELMELFTIGRGHYSEQDVQEAARAFTGWSSTLQGTYRFRPFWHDYGSKTFMGHTGKFGGDDIIDLILERRETADFIAQKLYRYFVHPAGHSLREQELAEVLYQSDYHIGQTMSHLLRADWFYAPENWRVQIKSPVVLLAGLMRALQVKAPDRMSLVYIQRLLGQTLFRPPNVAGWPQGRQWIDNATLMNRLNLAQAIVQGSSLPGRAKDNPKAANRTERPAKMQVEVDLRPLWQLVRAASAKDALNNLMAYLLPGQSVSNDLIRQYSRGASPQEEVAFMAVRLMTMPEYQLC